MNNHPIGSNYAHAEMLVAAQFTLAHNQFQDIPLAIVSDGHGFPIKAMVLEQTSSIFVNPLHFVHVHNGPVKGKYWLLITSHPIPSKYAPMVVTWLLRNYEVMPKG